MEEFTLELTGREAFGKLNNSRLRKGGKVPGVVYGKGLNAVHIEVVENDFVKLARRVRSSQVFKLKSTDSRLNGRTAIVKEIQRVSTSGAVLHIDFQALRDDQAINITVTLAISGEPFGVKQQGGVLTVARHDVAVKCLPKDIPAAISVNVEELHIGQSIHARDLQLPPGVTLVEDADETIASVVAPKKIMEAVPEAVVAEGAVPVEGEASAPAEGAEEAAEKEEKKEKKEKK